jgi:hypothetical protein
LGPNILVSTVSSNVFCDNFHLISGLLQWEWDLNVSCCFSKYVSSHLLYVEVLVDLNCFCI